MSLLLRLPREFFLFIVFLTILDTVVEGDQDRNDSEEMNYFDQVMSVCFRIIRGLFYLSDQPFVSVNLVVICGYTTLPLCQVTM